MSALRRRPQVADHADVELALHESHDARGFRGVDPERRGHELARTTDEIVAGSGSAKTMSVALPNAG